MMRANLPQPGDGGHDSVEESNAAGGTLGQRSGESVEAAIVRQSLLQCPYLIEEPEGAQPNDPPTSWSIPRYVSTPDNFGPVRHLIFPNTMPNAIARSLIRLCAPRRSRAFGRRRSASSAAGA